MTAPAEEFRFELTSLDELKRWRTLTFAFRHPRFGLHDIAVFWDGEGAYALDNACPHMFGALADGMLRRGEVHCPLHGAQFDLRTGKCIDLYTIDVAAYAVEVRDGIVWITAPGEQRA